MLAELAGEYAKELQEKQKVIQSYRFSLRVFTVLALHSEILNDYEKNLKVCEEALSYFQNKKHIASDTVLFSFSIRTLVSYISLGTVFGSRKNGLKVFKATTRRNHELVCNSRLLHDSTLSFKTVPKSFQNLPIGN